MMVQSTLREIGGRTPASIAVGAVVGLVLSVIPICICLLLSVALLVVLFIRMRSLSWRRDAGTTVAVCIVLMVCFVLPVKQFDGKVGPMAYDDLSLSELCDRLYKDHGIVCFALGESAHASRISFSTSQPLSRRDVLKRLGRDTNRPLHIGYCLSGATILFGAHPSFTYLGEEFDRVSVPKESSSEGNEADCRRPVSHFRIDGVRAECHFLKAQLQVVN